ncbi:hypothetical protein JCM8097_000709 [Rhodosporidiobolus ruineniae]
MQSAPRILRTSLLARATAPSPAFAQPTSYATPSSSLISRSRSPSYLHSCYSTFSTATASTYTPSTRIPTSFVRSDPALSSSSASFHPQQRGFASSSRALAREADQNPFEDPKFAEHAPLFERIAQSPEVLDAIENMARITHEKTGVNLQGGDKPSMMMMLQLARDPDLRAAAERLMAALKSSGIEVDPRQAFQALSMMGGEGFDSVKNGLEGLHEKVRRGDGNGEGEGEKK